MYYTVFRQSLEYSITDYDSILNTVQIQFTQSYLTIKHILVQNNFIINIVVIVVVVVVIVKA